METGERSRTFLVGASVVGTPSLSHGRTPVMAFGQTAINPDVTDLYFEEIKDKTHYLSSNGQWEPLGSIEESIKVKGQPDYNLKIKYTRNGVLIPPDFVDGTARDIMPWISGDLLTSDVFNHQYRALSLANIYDPITVDRFENESKDFDFSLSFEGTTLKKSSTAQDIVDEVIRKLKVPTNTVIAIARTGEIAYITTGKFPVRNFKVG